MSLARINSSGLDWDNVCNLYVVYYFPRFYVGNYYGDKVEINIQLAPPFIQGSPKQCAVCASLWSQSTCLGRRELVMLPIH